MQKPLLEPAYSAVLFDMDNTLFDFVAAMKRGAAAAADTVGFGTGDQLFSYYLRWKYHIEDHANLQDFMMDNQRFSVDGYLAAVKAFEDAKFTGLAPYPGIPDLLSGLKQKGYRLGIVTDAYEYAAVERLKHTGLDAYFDVVVAYDLTGYKKPHHAPFEYAMSLLDTMPHETIYVGDSIRRDIEPAKALGLAAVYAAYGDRNFYEPNRTCPPRVIVAESPEDIGKILL
ncbi:Phosphoglycolate phosphatase [Methanocorpusculaceae archaeon Sp1]|uniref:Phosphoglycolate phosphatase n=1 Tax=Methanorbis furvi TaxID=3028299 RepID=A0AAE4S9X7_9EURY|nr:Phosphoglycolate phosphatase [Methanocorpusculaceae archaeon Sp1]MDV0441394.1 Phosphoglycolate phosphatase [Methanocorpusculaceae archaeon Ag1]